MKQKKLKRTKPKSRKSFFQRNWQLLLVAFAFISVGVASAALIAPKQPYPHTTTFDGDVAVYRPADKAWIDTAIEDLQPLDFLLKDGRAYHVKAAYTDAAGRVQAVPLGAATRVGLERHLGNYDPEDKSYPQTDTELVYAKWQGSELKTFQPLGVLKDGDLFQHNGREFLTRIHADGSRGVKPTGNVVSQVTGIWSEHHDNQIHLTLFFPEVGETNKIITTHEHPFYVPTTDTWVPAADLKVGMALQTCDGTPVHVAKWLLVDEPFTAYNIEVANSHTYYVADPNNPDAPPVLVHNDCDIRWTPNTQKKLRKHAQDIYTTARENGTEISKGNWNSVRNYINDVTIDANRRSENPFPWNTETVIGYVQGNSVVLVKSNGEFLTFLDARRASTYLKEKLDIN
jgi:hypothetical protein